MRLNRVFDPPNGETRAIYWTGLVIIAVVLAALSGSAQQLHTRKNARQVVMPQDDSATVTVCVGLPPAQRPYARVLVSGTDYLRALFLDDSGCAAFEDVPLSSTGNLVTIAPLAPLTFASINATITGDTWIIFSPGIIDGPRVPRRTHGEQP